MDIKRPFIKLSTALFFLSFLTSCERPSHPFNKNFGGSTDEHVASIESTEEAGYVLAGWSKSKSGDVGGNRFFEYDALGDTATKDAWILKLDKDGNVEWENNYGGVDHDAVTSIKQTPDGGFIATGWSRSSYGDLKHNHGAKDVWVFKIDPEGNVVWQKNYGGSYIDQGSEVEVLKGDTISYLVTASSRSQDGDVSTDASYSYWILALNKDGKLIWEKTYSYGRFCGSSAIVERYDKGSLVTGAFFSASQGDFPKGRKGWGDLTLKLDRKGDLKKKHYFAFHTSASIIQATDSAYILVGKGTTPDSVAKYKNDKGSVAITKFKANGKMVWTSYLGGKNEDRGNDVLKTRDGGYIVVGSTEGHKGEIEIHGKKDVFILKVDGNGKLLWYRTYGGSKFDEAVSITKAEGKGYVIAANSRSYDGDLPDNKGGQDLWIFKIDEKGEIMEQSSRDPS